MAIKDSMFSWFIRNIVLPRNEIIDRPGFIILKLSKKKGITNLREIVIPEKIFTELEREIIEKYKDAGKQILYSTGKKFGYRYASISHYPTIKESSEEEFLKFTYFVIRYLESIYSSEISHDIDVKKKVFRIYLKDYIVCSKNGFGFILTDGSITGMCAYGIQNPSVEGKQIKCQGRGDEKCEFICAPADYFRKNGIKIFTERNMEGSEIKLLNYNAINALRRARFASNSLKTLIDGGFVKYKHGTLTYNEERFLLIESSIMYLLERELKKLDGGLELLWEISFEWGENFSKKFKRQNPCKLINDLFPGFGFGDFFAITENGNYKVSVGFFPWTELANEIDFIMFRGMLSGIISGMAGKKVELKKIKKGISSEGFSLVIEE